MILEMSIVNSNVSRLSTIPEVRNFLLSKQRGYGKQRSCYGWT